MSSDFAYHTARKALEFLLSMLDSRSNELAGYRIARTEWTRFLSGDCPPPVNPEVSQNVEFVGQTLASFIRNDARRHVAESEGHVHELRAALGDAVRALSVLVAVCTEHRQNANHALNQLEDCLCVETSESSESLDTIRAVRRMLRSVDEAADEQRRILNSRLANLRTSILDVNRFVHSDGTPIGRQQAERCLERFRLAGRQLGESIALVGLKLPPHLDRDQVNSAATVVRGIFQRDIDVVVAIETSLFVVIIDTPAAAINTLLDRLAGDLSALPVFDSREILLGYSDVDPFSDESPFTVSSIANLSSMSTRLKNQAA